MLRAVDEEITITQLCEVADHSLTDLRTVLNAYQGRGKGGRVRERVARAARELGYPEPPAGPGGAEEGA